MAQIDRLLAAVVSQRADGLRLAGDDAVHLVSGGDVRPLTRQALTAQQIVALLREIAPDEAAREIEAGRAVSFRYASGDGRFVAELRTDAGRWSATVMLEGTGDVRRVTGDLPAVPTASAVPAAVVPPSRDAEALAEMERLLRTLVVRGGSGLLLR
jgi:Tfp pilus assembly ATPase PilU